MPHTLLDVISNSQEILDYLHMRDIAKLRCVSSKYRHIQPFRVANYTRTTILNVPQPLPKSITELNVSFCEVLVKLPELPPNLKVLDLSFCPRILKLPDPLPETLLVLRCYESNLQTIPKLPLNLKELNCKDCRFNNLPDLPPSLEKLNCHRFQITPEYLPVSLKYLSSEILPSDLPAGVFENLVHLEFRYTRSLKTISILPPKLETLTCHDCWGLNSISSLPSTLKNLTCVYCPGLRTLPEFLPPGLTKLRCSQCMAMENLSGSFPREVITLHINHTSLQGVLVFPTKLKHLICQNTHLENVDFLPELKILTIFQTSQTFNIPALPSSLKELRFKFCTKLEYLPCSLPKNLVILDFSCCKSLREIPPLPSTLQLLTCLGCERLENLPSLPPDLKLMNCNGSKSLRRFPILPFNLRALACKWCDSLEEFPISLNSETKVLIDNDSPMTWYHKVMDQLKIR